MTYDIQVKNAQVYFPVEKGHVKAVDQVSVTFREGQITGLIGESGCGKSVLGMYLLGLLPPYAKVSGEIWYQGKNLEALNQKERRQIRGRELGLIPQNPGDSLNPVRRIRGQIQEAVNLTEEKTGVSSLLERFGFSKEQVPRVERAYPFALSGGMQQRAVAAMGVASNPKWILADEPSKGLDMTLREQMYETLALIRKQKVKGMLIITHDLVLAEKLCGQVAVMYAGQILEMGGNVLEEPLHPYTKGLLDSLPERGMHPMKGIAPAPGDELKGCKFAPRCPYAGARCEKEQPQAFQAGERKVRCFRYA
ncbi:MAG: ABC transporter ATP-binding protein [Eubacteriales bacterium]|nr:ABC transporter ATP-binding protein [Eubacteriales bacterium]